MKADVTTNIHIIEHDGKVSIQANVPDNAEGTVAGALTHRLLEYANQIMNEVTDSIEQIREHKVN